MSQETISEIPDLVTFKVESFALSYLKKGREEWDEPHTRAVVYYAVDIAGKNNLDTLVIFTAAWFHDIGYFGQFLKNESEKYDSVQDKKEEHMINGVRLAEEFFKEPWIDGWYTQVQKERVIHLVSVHDKISKLKDLDEIVLMEADTLGAIDVSKVKPTFNKEEALKYIEKSLMGKRVPKFQTKEGKAYLEKLLPIFKAYHGIN